MSFAFAPKKIKVRALSKDILVVDMDMGDMTTSGGIVIQSDNGKAHGVKPRWAKVYKVGSEVDIDVKVGQWVLIEHGRWTRKIKIDDGASVKEIQKVEVKAVLAVTDERPSTAYWGQEYSNGDSATIRPEDFGAR